MKRLALLIVCCASACVTNAFDGLLGQYDKLPSLYFGFQDSRSTTTPSKTYSLMLRRGARGSSEHFSLNNEPIAGAEIKAKVSRCYELATQAVREFHAGAGQLPFKQEDFLAISINGQSVGVTLSFEKGVLAQNPKLAELQRTLESLLPH